MQIRFVVAGVAVLGLVGCGNYKTDVQTMCDAPSLAEKKAPGFRTTMDPSQQAVVMANVIASGIHSSEGKALFNRLGTEAHTPKDKATMLSAEATKQGITKCELADFWNAYGSPAAPTGSAK